MSRFLGESETDYQWRIKCGAAIIGLYGALELCLAIEMNPHDLLDLVETNIPRFRKARQHAAMRHPQPLATSPNVG